MISLRGLPSQGFDLRAGYPTTNWKKSNQISISAWYISKTEPVRINDAQKRGGAKAAQTKCEALILQTLNKV